MTTSRSPSCSRGTASSSFGGRRLPAEPGDVFFIDDSQPHVARAEPGADLRLLLVLFRPELIAGPGCREFDLGLPGRLPTGRSRRRHLGSRGSSPLSAQIWPVLSELQRLCDRADRREQQLVDATLRRALALVNRDRGATEPRRPVDQPRPAAELIRPVLAYIDRHGGEPITLEQVAAVAHVSPSRIRHVFKEVTGRRLQGLRHARAHGRGQAPAALDRALGGGSSAGGQLYQPAASSTRSSTAHARCRRRRIAATTRRRVGTGVALRPCDEP